MTTPTPEGYDSLFRLLALLMLGIRVVYWTVTEQQANRAKPRVRHRTVGDAVKRMISGAVVLVLGLQLAGIWDLWPFQTNLAHQGLGLVIAALGFALSMSARHTLGTNWAHAADYQIKAGHTLITTGVYRYIRHPIYTGSLLSVVGSELVVHSWLAVVCLIIIATVSLFQARQEEALLLDKFGDDYRAYMKRSARFIPGLW